MKYLHAMVRVSPWNRLFDADVSAGNVRVSLHMVDDHRDHLVELT